MDPRERFNLAQVNEQQYLLELIRVSSQILMFDMNRSNYLANIIPKKIMALDGNLPIQVNETVVRSAAHEYAR